MASALVDDLVRSRGWFAIDHQSGEWLRGSGDKVTLRSAFHPDSRCIVAPAHFGPATSGAPATVHGGAVASVMDEVLGSLTYCVGMPTATAWIKTTFVSPLMVGTPTFLVGRISVSRVPAVVSLTFCVCMR
jgi:hypothetical protein